MDDSIAKSGGTFTGDVTFADGADIITASKGTNNVRLGENAGDSIASGGNNNVAVGKNAGTAMTTATNSVFVGALAGDATVGAANNTGVGYQSLSANAGNKNTAVGSRAGVAVTGVNNTIIGEEAGILCTGDGNTFVGAYGASTGGSGEAMTTGSKNTILGAYTGNQSGLDIRTLSNHIVLSDGDGDVPFFITSSQGMKVDGGSGDLGSTTDPTHELAGGYGNSYYLTRLRVTSSVGYPLALQFANSAPNNSTQTFIEAFDNVGHKFRVTSAGDVLNLNNSYGALSDVKLKENIADSGSQWDDVKALRVRKYSMKKDEVDAPNRLGVIAQELEDAGMNNLINEIPDATPDNPDLTTTTKTVKYSVLYMKAIKALQEAMTRIETLEAQNTTQATQIADLITRVTALEAE